MGAPLPGGRPGCEASAAWRVRLGAGRGRALGRELERLRRERRVSRSLPLPAAALLLDVRPACGHGRAMRTIMLLRHGKSSWSDPTLADLERPLAARGERASRRIAKHLRRKRIRPDLVLCSPSLRTRQTLEAIRPSLGKRCSVELVAQLYAASEEELLERIRTVPESAASVLLIGHNPGLQKLALVLASRGADLAKLEQKFPTGALATLIVGSDSWASLEPGAAELADYVLPKQLGRG